MQRTYRLYCARTVINSRFVQYILDLGRNQTRATENDALYQHINPREVNKFQSASSTYSFRCVHRGSSLFGKNQRTRCCKLRRPLRKNNRETNTTSSSQLQTKDTPTPFRPKQVAVKVGYNAAQEIQPQQFTLSVPFCVARRYRLKICLTVLLNSSLLVHVVTRPHYLAVARINKAFHHYTSINRAR